MFLVVGILIFIAGAIGCGHFNWLLISHSLAFTFITLHVCIGTGAKWDGNGIGVWPCGGSSLWRDNNRRSSGLNGIFKRGIWTCQLLVLSRLKHCLQQYHALCFRSEISVNWFRFIPVKETECQREHTILLLNVLR